MEEKERIQQILEKLPLIRKLIKDGYKWEVLKFFCEPIGLNDTAFRDNPKLEDYLMDENYWKKRLVQNTVKHRKEAEP